MKKRSAVGYLKGKGGDQTRSPDETKQVVKNAFAALRKKIDTLEEEALNIEDLMTHLAHILKISQPQGMYREMSIRWWKTSANSAREPILCRTEPNGRNGRLKVVPAKKAMKLRKDRAFAIGADIACQAVSHYWELKTLRDNINHLIRTLNTEASRGVSQRTKTQLRIATRMQHDQDQMMSRIDDTLQHEEDDPM